MHFLISVIDNATGTGNAEELAAIDAFNDGLRADGHWVFAGGLAAPDRSMVIDNRNDAGEVAEGPLVTSREYISGFWLITAPDAATARRLALEGSRACNRKVELRPLLGGGGQ